MSSTFHEAVSRTSNVFDRPPTQLKLTICHPWVESWTLAHSCGGGDGDGIAAACAGPIVKARSIVKNCVDTYIARCSLRGGGSGPRRGAGVKG